MAEQLTITAPDDWHVHLRDEEMLERVVHTQPVVFVGPS